MVTFGQKGVKMSSKTSPFCVLLFFSQRKRESAEPPNPKRVVTRDPVVICLWKQKEATPSISSRKWTLWKEWLTFLHMQKHVFKSVKKRHLFVFCSFFPKENVDQIFGKFPKQWRHEKRVFCVTTLLRNVKNDTPSKNGKNVCLQKRCRFCDMFTHTKTRVFRCQKATPICVLLFFSQRKRGSSFRQIPKTVTTQKT